ncbi:MAG TPA: carboxypeptidase-like regulatory domain-containing protein, partial [Candidatus Saccharicenans sp.]|nr:carboxypeptidase-like regulatory domain-containing protein [Candidatus Saccharicenans sp.]HPC88673.1 carboxypeptidase-like regulatory domain-containing protein [Candidatus Saccharicenans sp.]HQE65192.1 carboxypeptidase-like regulatory domain-containing protein [Candidatus Saccharicenans sp.]HQI23054.1 carboxypeptidase-like regulatory domain-containing protein [Candidatus Saccharicenans sp.]HRT26464.1 carboxypeptidase-like regulatory domain-containing protein [Candidatus Saccharicenans sp.]
MVKKFLIVFMSVLLFSPLVFAQSRETGAITGTVIDEAGAPLPGVTVTLSGPSLMGIRTYVTDARGVYRFPALPPGN